MCHIWGAASQQFARSCCPSLTDKAIWQWPLTPFMMNSSALKKGLTKMCISSHLQADNMPSAPLVLIMFPLESESVEDCSNKTLSHSRHSLDHKPLSIQFATTSLFFFLPHFFSKHHAAKAVWFYPYSYCKH